MGRTLEYALVTLFALATAYLIVTPLVGAVSQSIINSANVIADATGTR